MNSFFKIIDKTPENYSNEQIYIFEEPLKLKFDSSVAELSDLFTLIQSLKTDELDPKIVKQRVSLGKLLSISVNENVFISSLLPSKKIVDSLFKLMNIINPMSDVLNEITSNKIKLYNLTTTLGFKEKFETFNDIQYYEINVNSTLFNKRDYKKVISIKLRHYFKHSEILDNLDKDILIINNNDHKKFIHEQLNLKYSMDVPYSSENYNYLKNILEMDTI